MILWRLLLEFREFDQDFWEELDNLVNKSKIVLDRPKGTAHPRFPSLIYPVDYGYLEGTSTIDGGGIDIWVGTKDPQKIESILCTVDTRKKDTEIKILYGCNSHEKEMIYNTHNSKYTKAIVIDR